MGSKASLTKYDKVVVFGQVLQQECPGMLLPVKIARQIIAKTFGHVSRQSYYNTVETLHEVLGVVEPIDGEGLFIHPSSTEAI